MPEHRHWKDQELFSIPQIPRKDPLPSVFGPPTSADQMLRDLVQSIIGTFIPNTPQEMVDYVAVPQALKGAGAALRGLRGLGQAAGASINAAPDPSRRAFMEDLGKRAGAVGALGGSGAAASKLAGPSRNDIVQQALDARRTMDTLRSTRGYGSPGTIRAHRTAEDQFRGAMSALASGHGGKVMDNVGYIYPRAVHDLGLRRTLFPELAEDTSSAAVRGGRARVREGGLTSWADDSFDDAAYHTGDPRFPGEQWADAITERFKGPVR